ncbi:hypothetical protein [Nostoc favosum]|nr:hypothetical protein [Nostoc favosum]
MPSISLDGFSPLKRDENFYLWLALRLLLRRRGHEEAGGAEGAEGAGEAGEAGEDKGEEFSPLPPAPCTLPLCFFSMPHAPCPMPHAPCPMPIYRLSIGV